MDVNVYTTSAEKLSRKYDLPYNISCVELIASQVDRTHTRSKESSFTMRLGAISR